MYSIVCNLKRIILKIPKSRKSKFRQHPAHPEILAILIQTISEDEQDLKKKANTTILFILKSRKSKFRQNPKIMQIMQIMVQTACKTCMFAVEF